MAEESHLPEVVGKDDLVAYLESGCSPKPEWRIGTEHEKFLFCGQDYKPLPYSGEKSIQRLLSDLHEKFGWQAGYEEGNIIALSQNGASVTLEPGGQLELSGAPLLTLHETCLEVHRHLKQVKEVIEPLGIGMLGMGANPKWGPEDIIWMPKGRYRIMREYMPTRGSLGTTMMVSTCTVQVNLDYATEADMVQKFRTSLALQPIATSLFANSPFTKGKPNGFASYRSYAWTDTDPDRCGVPSFVFDESMGFERYVDYMLDVPMYFVCRGGAYLDASGKSFRDFLAGKLDILPNQRPTMKDWEDHLTTAFPEVRLKKYLEMRGADGGPWSSICALPALWVGLLYDEDALEAAWDLVKDWRSEDHQGLRKAVPRSALKAPICKTTVQDVAKEMLKIAESGLRNRMKMDGLGKDETGFLQPLWEVAESGKTQAEIKLEQYQKEWNQSVDPIFREYAY